MPAEFFETGAHWCRASWLTDGRLGRFSATGVLIGRDSGGCHAVPPSACFLASNPNSANNTEQKEHSSDGIQYGGNVFGNWCWIEDHRRAPRSSARLDEPHSACQNLPATISAGWLANSRR